MASPATGIKKLSPIRVPQKAPEAAPGPGQADGLLDTDLALVVTPGIGGVLQLQQLLAGQITGQVEHPLGVIAVVQAEHHQVGHEGLQDVNAAASAGHHPFWGVSRNHPFRVNSLLTVAIA
jgi:hypothetical protein